MAYFNFKYRIILSLLFLALSLQAQYLELKPEHNINQSVGDDLMPFWSDNGSSIVFQSNRNGNWDIFQYNFHTDTITQLTNTPANEEHPALLNNGKRLAYTSDVSGEEQLYFYNLNTAVEKAVFEREINAKAASFPTSEYLLYCLGFDGLSKEWGLYRYEFKYNSLKYVLPFSTDQYLPKLSADGEYILYVSENAATRVKQLNIINWYGNADLKISDFVFYEPSWYPGDLKIIFLSDMDNMEGEIYTIWKDGTHLERLTNDTLTVKNPVVSPDGKLLAVSVLVNGQYDLFIVPLEDY